MTGEPLRLNTRWHDEGTMPVPHDMDMLRPQKAEWVKPEQLDYEVKPLQAWVVKTFLTHPNGYRSHITTHYVTTINGHPHCGCRQDEGVCPHIEAVKAYHEL